MFERWCTFELTAETFRQTIAAIGESLQKIGVLEREAETARQLLEHIYSLQLSLHPEVHVKVYLQKHFGDISVRMETIGKAYNPLQLLSEWNEDDPDYQRTIVLKSKKEMLSYTHSNGKNIVTIKVHEAGNKQIRYTLFAMFMGILAGALIQEIAGKSGGSHCESGYAADYFRLCVVRHNHQYAGRKSAASEKLH